MKRRMPAFIRYAERIIRIFCKEQEQEPFEDFLDAGCEPGSMIAILEEKMPDKHYTGIDLTPVMIEVARRKNLPNEEFIIGDCENLPFPDNSFDVILCSNSAHHYPDPEKFYQSVYHCLRPEGWLILRDITSEQPFDSLAGSTRGNTAGTYKRTWRC